MTRLRRHGPCGPAIDLLPGAGDELLPPRPLRDGIAALQDGRCFYCRRPLGSKPEADHFVPWIRCGIDAAENLVLADHRCNNDKRDPLPGRQMRPAIPAPTGARGVITGPPRPDPRRRSNRGSARTE